MTNLALNHTESPFDSIRHQDADGDFWYARQLTEMLGYPRWADAEDMIDRAKAACKNAGNSLLENFSGISLKTNGRPKQDYRLSRFACYLIAQNGDPRKPEIAQAQTYFAIKTREAEVIIPAQSEHIRLLELENENLRLRSGLVNTTSTLVALHGEALGLTIAGLNVGQIIETKVPTTEVLNPITGNCDEFLSADQLAKEVARRSGQKIKNAEFIRKLKAANRDDLILPVTRNATAEYIKPEDLDEAMHIVFGGTKQGLLKPVGAIISA
jgi:hypothetical protein